MYMRICMNFPRLTETFDEATTGRVGAMSIDTRRRNRQNAGNQQLDTLTDRQVSEMVKRFRGTVFNGDGGTGQSNITNRDWKLGVSRGSTTKRT